MRIVHRYPDLETASQAAADRIQKIITESIQQKGRCALALAGGKTPERLYAILGTMPIPWTNVYVFFTDERMVPSTDPRSNFRMAYDRFLSRVPANNVFPIETEQDAELAAQRYEDRLNAFFGSKPAFDLALLGVGSDGHTASIFPGSPYIETERATFAVLQAAGGPALPRVSLSLASINSALYAVFLVSESGKKSVIQAILNGDRSLPSTRVSAKKETLWIIAP